MKSHRIGIRKGVSLLLLLVFCLSLLGGIAPLYANVPPPSGTVQESTESALPEIIDIREAAERGYTARLETEESGKYMLMFRNLDGGRTLRLFSHPVKYEDASGNLRDISLRFSSVSVRIPLGGTRNLRILRFPAVTGCFPEL